MGQRYETGNGTAARLCHIVTAPGRRSKAVIPSGFALARCPLSMTWQRRTAPASVATLCHFVPLARRAVTLDLGLVVRPLSFFRLRVRDEQNASRQARGLPATRFAGELRPSKIARTNPPRPWQIARTNPPRQPSGRPAPQSDNIWNANFGHELPSRLRTPEILSHDATTQERPGSWPGSGDWLDAAGSASRRRRRSRHSRSCSWATRGTTGRPTGPRRSRRCSPAGESTSPTPRNSSDLNPETLARYDALLIYANTTDDQPRPGKGPARLRRQRRRVRTGPLRIVLLPQFAQVHRARRGPVSAARHGRVRDQDRRSVASDHERLRPVSDLGRDLCAHQAQRQGSPRAANACRRKVRRALDLGADRGQGAGLLHGLRTRCADLARARVFTT